MASAPNLENPTSSPPTPMDGGSPRFVDSCKVAACRVCNESHSPHISIGSPPHRVSRARQVRGPLAAPPSVPHDPAGRCLCACRCAARQRSACGRCRHGRTATSLPASSAASASRSSPACAGGGRASFACLAAGVIQAAQAARRRLRGHARRGCRGGTPHRGDGGRRA